MNETSIPNCPDCQRPMYPLTGIGNERQCVQCVCGAVGLVKAPTVAPIADRSHA